MAHGDKQKAILAELEKGPSTASEMSAILGWERHLTAAHLHNLVKRELVVAVVADKNHPHAKPGAVFHLAGKAP